MRILYGVNGEGMGHATRSRVVIDELLKRHDVRVVASGAAFRYLSQTLPRVDEVFGPTFAITDGEIQRFATVIQNLKAIRRELPHTVREWMARVHEWRPQVVITDFEPLAAIYARSSRAPLIAVDNINMIDRCRHDEEIVGAEREDFRIARAVTNRMVGGATEYIVTTFFEPPITRPRTTLVPPIVRPEIESAVSERGDHLLVYASDDPDLLDALRDCGVPCRVYGMRGGPAEDEVEGNIERRPRSNDGFVEDLRTSMGVIAGGGFSLLSEAVYLGKPVLAIPLRGQFEQLMNARYLERSGYGLCAERVSREVIERFLGGIDGFERNLAGYQQDGNTVALRTIERMAETAAQTEPRELRRERRLARRMTS
jgi:uncharacterized protein (TIGR00661 family)